MGVSGSGKTTVGQSLANELNYSFYDADDFHPKSNVAKMASGQPLDDDDRIPWLKILAEKLSSWNNTVLACSALKESYRQLLMSKDKTIQWVYLEGSQETISTRMENREGHYMKTVMLESQLDTLEPPLYGHHISIETDPNQIVSKIIDKLKNAD